MGDGLADEVTRAGAPGPQEPGVLGGARAAAWRFGWFVATLVGAAAFVAVLLWAAPGDPIDLLPNGNLVIEGSRLVSFSGEKQYAILRGVVRPEDIANGNSVLSSSIADARVEFISQGAISESQRKGWWTRFYDAINPF